MTIKETKKRVPVSLRVITEMYETAKTNCMKTHGRVTDYGNVDINCNRTDERKRLDEAKELVIKKISSDIENYAVKTYTKYGVIIVPECHRSSSSGSDRLRIDLKVKEFPECKSELKACLEEAERFKSDMKKIEEWHMKALQSLAKKEDLPSLPETT